MPEFHHVGLTVGDIEASYRFYTDVVGMHLWDQDAALGTKRGLDTAVERSDNGPELIAVRSDAFDKLTNAKDTLLKYVMIQSPDKALIFQLIQYVEGGQGTLDLDHARAGSMHFSFFVDDVEAKYAEVTARGDVHVTSEVVQVSPNMRSFYAADPDGVPVEFMEITR